MNRFAVAWIVPFCTAALACAGEPPEWLPGPSAVNFGVVVDAHLLSYQWEPAPHIQLHRSIRISADYLSPPERWSALRPGETWDPKDIRWFWADLERGEVKPLKDAKPEEGEAFSRPGMFWMGWRPHNAPHRWRVGGGYFWGTGGGLTGGDPGWLFNMLRIRFVVGKASPGPAAAPAPCSESRQLTGKVATEAHESPEDAASWTPEVPFYGFYADSGLACNLAFVHRAFRRAHERRCDFDFIVGSSNHLVLVALVNGQVTVGDYRLRVKQKSAQGTSWKGEWRRRADFFDVPFSEPFHVAAADGAFFFVTDSGGVYMAEEMKGEWKTRTLWKEPDRPIIAMLVEADKPGGFVFGKDFYFHLARQIEPKPCGDVTKGPPDLGDPMRTVLECAKVLHKAGVLNDTERPNPSCSTP